MNRQTEPERAEARTEAEGMSAGELARLIREREAYGRAGQWRQGLEEIREKYPQLDVKQGLRAPGLKELLRAGVDFRTAFEAANLEEIRQYIELEAERRAYERMAMNAGRVTENGVASSKTAPFAAGPGGLSKEDREDIVKRVLKGEEIRL